MAYSPYSGSSAQPMAGTLFYPSLATNHDELYTAHRPPIFEQARSVSAIAASSQPLYRFRSRGNLDAQTLRARIRASGTLSATLSLTVDGVTTATQAIGADAFYQFDGTPISSTVHDCTINADTTGGGTITVTRALAHLVTTAPGTSTKQASGWVNEDGFAAADMPIACEFVERLRDGPVQLAKDRPTCLFAHLSRVVVFGTVLGKSWADWTAYDSTSAQTVGIGMLPGGADTRPRRYIVDAFVNRYRGTSDVVAQVKVGGWTWTVPAVNGWFSTTVELPPGPLPVTGVIVPGATTGAQFEALQIWRA